MEGVELNPSFWRDKSVFLTGHTGFKGAWLTLWLSSLGAKVHGYALAPLAEPSLFTVARVEAVLASQTMADLQDRFALTQAMKAAQPDIVLHLAAQAIVRRSYDDPVETYAVNVMGTVHLLDAVRSCASVRAVVSVTTDKCYENKEWDWGYRETEAMGGRDPYSSSKGCAELVTAAYRDSFLVEAGVAVATARAGNVIGGGDWAADRLVPDFFRAAQAGAVMNVRYPESTRPWQHVLEPLSGYVTLAEQLLTDGQSVAQAWNFGPREEDAQPVSWILDRLTHQLPGTEWQRTGGEHAHEARYLKLDSSKARRALGWHPRWVLEEALQKTVDWHRAWQSGHDMRAFSLAQIDAHQSLAQT